jgi:biotin-(acetyl-CoA carboxylase) ligase
LRKFHIYLEQKYQVKKTYLFIGYIKQYEEMYEQFRQYGYSPVAKKQIAFISRARKHIELSEKKDQKK